MQNCIRFPLEKRSKRALFSQIEEEYDIVLAEEMPITNI